MNLSDVATIKTVHAFRDRAAQYCENGNCHALTTRDLVGEWPVDYGKLPRVSLSDEHLKWALNEDDVLLPSRGDYYIARHFDGYSKTVIPVGIMYVIAVDPSLLTPGYLAWFLNQTASQEHLQLSAIGTSIRSLNKVSLTSLPVSLPDLPTQRAIARLQQLHFERLSLHKRFLDLSSAEVQSTCYNLFQRTVS